jgi:kynurenine formamidase
MQDNQTPDTVLTELAGALASGGVRMVDLTRTLAPDDPTIVMPPEFGQSWPVRIERISRYDGTGPAWYWNNISFGEHTGTHFDAPVHWVTGRDLPRNSVDTMPLEPMLAPACVIDCTEACARDADHLLTRDAILDWEAQHGRIEPGCWVIMRSGWGDKTGAEYANLQADGAHTPGPDAEAIRFLVDDRNILGFGTETIGTDWGQAGHLSPPYPAHHYLHGAGKYGLQCLTGLEALPPRGAMIFAAPLKIKAGSGSPLRVIALVPGSTG